ncbi:MAG: hypothetical protein M0T79_13975 [Actinomycetota bacterium]|nr:hypothetical protein [Actinomycetota bacterium]
MAAEASAALNVVSRVRTRTRLYRNGHWFASFVFGVVILGSIPFYVRSTPPGLGRATLFGRAFEGWPASPLARWSTLYWALGIAVGFGAVLIYYHLRARRNGVQGRLWPAVVVGLVLLGLAMWVNSAWGAGPRDFWFRGTSVLVVIAVGLLVLSGLERSLPFVVFAAGFFALALVSCLYTIVNVFFRLGIGAPFMGNGSLPNLVVPGAYLLVGGAAFLAFRGGRLPHRHRSHHTPSA